MERELRSTSPTPCRESERTRLRTRPRAGTSWNTTLLCGPDRLTVALVDFAAPLPGDDLTVRTEALESKQVLRAPLERYRVTVRGRGERFDDPAALLRGESGEPVDAELDLVWGAGRPFRYRLATRYEIACRVSGTLRIGDETFELYGALVSATTMGRARLVVDELDLERRHLDDGTHLHGSTCASRTRRAWAPATVQPLDGELTELSDSPPRSRCSSTASAARPPSASATST